MSEPDKFPPDEDAQAESGRGVPRLWGWPTFLSIGVTLLFLGWLVSMVDMKRMLEEVANCHKGYALLGGLCHYLTYPIRGLRWRRCLSQLPSRDGGRRRFGLVVFFYNFVDNIVPGKLGDVYAAHLARINFGIRRSAAIGSIVFVRMVDSWVVLGLAVLSAWSIFSIHLPRPVAWSLMGGVTIAVAATLIILLVLLLRGALPSWVPEKIASIIQAFRSGMFPNPRDLPTIATTTAVIWLLETLWLYFLVLAFDLRPSPMEAVFLTMVPVIATAFPLTPSGAGAVEVTLFSCLRVIGVPAPLAASITLVNRFIDYWLHIVLGALVWVGRRPLGLRSWREVDPVFDIPEQQPQSAKNG